MLDTSNCKLFHLNRKKELFYLLNISNENEAYAISKKYEPYIKTRHNKERLIEPPVFKLKETQKRIKGLLSTVELPEWLISASKKTYLNNYKHHINNSYIMTVDIHKFFPSCHREYIYRFFITNLQTSPDVAKLLTDLTTINLNKIDLHDDKNRIFQYIQYNNVRNICHLPTGSPTSSILSFLAYYEMFSEIKHLADINNITMTVYIDDITFSSKKYISKKFIFQVKSVLGTYGHIINIDKVKMYKKNDYKLITGVAVSPDNIIKVPNKLQYSIINTFQRYKDGKKSNLKLKKSLLGKILAARQIEKGIFRGIYKYVKES